MEKNHILSELDKIKTEFSDAKQSYEVKERKFAFDLENSFIELDFDRKQHLEVS